MSDRIPRRRLEDMPKDLARYLRDTKVERLGYLGEFFQCAANNPNVLMRFMAFTDALGQALQRRLTELVALTVAGRMANAYERNQHERLCVALGFARDWIAAVGRLAPDAAAALTAAERAVQRYVLAAVDRHGIGVEREFDAMLDQVSPAEAMAVTMLVGRYVCHALVVNTLGLAPPVPSIFEAGGDA